MQRSDSAMDTRSLSLSDAGSGKASPKDSLDLHILGVCTGNALNELDFALLHYRQDAPNATLSIDMKQYCELPVHHSIRTPILNLLRDVQTKPTITAHIDALLGRMFSQGIKTFCRIRDIDIATIDIIATYTPDLGRPKPCPSRNTGRHPFDWHSIIKNETGRTVVFNFSVLERAMSSSSISPIAFVDSLLLRHPSKFRACINIDEIININFIPPFSEHKARGTVSRDCGPGSLLIDYAMKYCTSNEQGEDNDGRFAAGGRANEAIVDRFLAAYDYRLIGPPLSIAREMFGDHEAQRLVDECLYSRMSEEDTVATATMITAQNITMQYRRLLESLFPPGQKVDELFICGPGAQNSCIIDYLEAELPESVVTKPLDDIGIPGDANEAVSYAHLALEAVLGQATQPVENTTTINSEGPNESVRGTIVQGDNWEKLHDKLHRFSQGQSLHITKDVKVAGCPASGMKLHSSR